jgi:hypothetical protein
VSTPSQQNLNLLIIFSCSFNSPTLSILLHTMSLYKLFWVLNKRPLFVTHINLIIKFCLKEGGNVNVVCIAIPLSKLISQNYVVLYFEHFLIGF